MAAAAGWTDLHNHVIPGVDDGAREASDAVAAVRSLQAQGVEHIIATPHLDGSLTLDTVALERRLTELDQGWTRLNEALDDSGIARVARGTELKLDVPEVDLSDPRLRLDGGATILVEFPFMSVPPRSAEVLGKIVAAGYQPLLAHPERYQGVDRELAVVRSWLDAGAFLQVNAGALIGSYGPGVMERSRRIIARGWAHCVASDFHSRGSPDLAAARSWLEDVHGVEPSLMLFEVNPGRLLRGETPLPVVPVPRERPSMLRWLVDRLPWAKG